MEHQYAPELVLGVAGAGEVFLPGAGDGFRVKKSFGVQAVGVEELFGPGAEGAAEPVADGDAEAGFGAFEKFGGDVAGQELS